MRIQHFPSKRLSRSRMLKGSSTSDLSRTCVAQPGFPDSIMAPKYKKSSTRSTMTALHVVQPPPAHFRVDPFSGLASPFSWSRPNTSIPPSSSDSTHNLDGSSQPLAPSHGATSATAPPAVHPVCPCHVVTSTYPMLAHMYNSPLHVYLVTRSRYCTTILACIAAIYNDPATSHDSHCSILPLPTTVSYHLLPSPSPIRCLLVGVSKNSRSALSVFSESSNPFKARTWVSFPIRKVDHHDPLFRASLSLLCGLPALFAPTPFTPWRPALAIMTRQHGHTANRFAMDVPEVPTPPHVSTCPTSCRVLAPYAGV